MVLLCKVSSAAVGIKILRLGSPQLEKRWPVFGIPPHSQAKFVDCIDLFNYHHGTKIFALSIGQTFILILCMDVTAMA